MIQWVYVCQVAVLQMNGQVDDRISIIYFSNLERVDYNEMASNIDNACLKRLAI